MPTHVNNFKTISKLRTRQQLLQRITASFTTSVFHLRSEGKGQDFTLQFYVPQNRGTFPQF